MAFGLGELGIIGRSGPAGMIVDISTVGTPERERLEQQKKAAKRAAKKGPVVSSCANE